jgi:hypothetical protein
MKVLVLGIFTIGIFLVVGTRFKLLTFRSFVIQVAVLLTLFAGLVLNTFHNWGYFKQYQGPEGAKFHTAHYIQDILIYGLVGTIVFFCCSVVSRIHRDSAIKKSGNQHSH